MANKKDSKVRDLKAKKDVKGGGPGIRHSNPPLQQGAGPTHTAAGGHPTHTAAGGGGNRGGI
jgi:hypothetical protein